MASMTDILIRAYHSTTAFNAAVLEWETAQLDDPQPLKAIQECAKAINKLVKEIEKYDS